MVCPWVCSQGAARRVHRRCPRTACPSRAGMVSSPSLRRWCSTAPHVAGAAAARSYSMVYPWVYLWVCPLVRARRVRRHWSKAPACRDGVVDALHAAASRRHVGIFFAELAVVGRAWRLTSRDVQRQVTPHRGARCGRTVEAGRPRCSRHRCHTAALASVLTSRCWQQQSAAGCRRTAVAKRPRCSSPGRRTAALAAALVLCGAPGLR